MLFDEQFDIRATMFQPVGGMDRIPYAFAKALGDSVKYRSPVTEIRKTSKGVTVVYKNTVRQRRSTLTIASVPCRLLLFGPPLTTSVILTRK
jgi:monoamine oxidase